MAQLAAHVGQMKRHTPAEDLLFQVRIPKEKYWRYAMLMQKAMDAVNDRKPVDHRVLSLLTSLFEIEDISTSGLDYKQHKLIEEQTKAICQRIKPEKEYSFEINKKMPPFPDLPPFNKKVRYEIYNLSYFVRHLLVTYHFHLPHKEGMMKSSIERNETIKALYASFLELMDNKKLYHKQRNKSKTYDLTKFKMLVIVMKVVEYLGFYIGQYPDGATNRQLYTVGDNALGSKGERERYRNKKAAI